MLKKIMASLLVFSLFTAPIITVLNVSPAEVSAKGYKSGKRSFTPSTNKSPSKFQNNQNQKVDQQKATTNPTNKANAATGNKGGFMKGMLLGGLAGMLFGGLLGNMGMLGSILGFMINIAAILFLVMIIRKIFVTLKKKREEANPWQN